MDPDLDSEKRLIRIRTQKKTRIRNTGFFPDPDLDFKNPDLSIFWVNLLKNY